MSKINLVCVVTVALFSALCFSTPALAQDGSITESVVVRVVINEGNPVPGGIRGTGGDDDNDYNGGGNVEWNLLYSRDAKEEAFAMADDWVANDFFVHYPEYTDVLVLEVEQAFVDGDNYSTPIPRYHAGDNVWEHKIAYLKITFVR